jgi:methyl-accepting chemotaxis protein
MDKVTQSNAASAEESAAAAQELNAQAETMKTSVAELLRLVGNAVASEIKPVAKPFKSGTNGKLHTNGHASHQAAPVAAVVPGTHRRKAIPLDDDFKNF